MSGRDGKGYTLFMLVIPGMIAGLILAAGCTGLQTPLPSLRRRPVEYTVFSTSSSGSTAPPDPQAVSGEHRFRGMIPPGAGETPEADATHTGIVALVMIRSMDFTFVA